MLNIEAIGHVDTDDLTLVINDAGVRIEDPPATDVVHPVSCLTEGSELTFANIVIKELGIAIRDGNSCHNVVTLKEVESEHDLLVSELDWSGFRLDELEGFDTIVSNGIFAVATQSAQLVAGAFERLKELMIPPTVALNGNTVSRILLNLATSCQSKRVHVSEWE